ncbi:hypothetical protein [Streptomyces zaomyceticus]|uniref:hypothetical protein n=1 Tax=Streptomyces zaomyceticus TaxID=68286 RepID=UPI0036A624F6
MTYTPTTWAQKVLALLGVPVSDANVKAMVAWQKAEGGHWNNPDKYNPLNTTQSMPGAVATNSHGVKAYTSWDQGLTATVKTLTNGLYGGILDALRRGDSAESVVGAVTRSPWGTKTISLDGSTYNPKDIPGVTPALDVPVPNLGGGIDLQSLAVTGAVLLGGVVLVVLGMVRGTAPVRQAVEQKATAAAGAVV